MTIQSAIYQGKARRRPVSEIVSGESFKKGWNEMRNNKAPDFDQPLSDYYAYERARQIYAYFCGIGKEPKAVLSSNSQMLEQLYYLAAEAGAFTTSLKSTPKQPSIEEIPG